MHTLVLGLLAETFIHPGMGSVGGAIDLPVAREAVTDYPVIAGSSLKGAIKDKAEQDKPSGLAIERVFGVPDSAGEILVSDARLLSLPVRCLSGSYKWITCPHLLERLARDLTRCGHGGAKPPDLSSVPAKCYLGDGTGVLYLEERRFEWQGPLPENMGQALAKLVAHDATRNRLASQLVVLNDGDFTWFARYGLAVQARNVLDGNKKSQNLWYEETLPPDSLFYALIAGRNLEAVIAIKGLMTAKPYLQAGGNETVGQGWFAVQPLGD